MPSGCYGKAPDTPPGQVVRADRPVPDTGHTTSEATPDPAPPAPAAPDTAAPSDDTTTDPDPGALCADQSRKRVAGQSGTAFSACVTALSRLAAGRADTPAAACRALSRKHVAGERGTAYSRCVAAAAALLDRLGDDDVEDPADTPDPAAR